MKFSLAKGQRQEAQPNLSGQCQSCGHPMVAKCGEVRIWHWAHQRSRVCDHWWENETEWHRAWKGQFPDNWQEVVHPAENGMKHIADVKTERGWVIEFQHSYIKPEERRSRDAFYPKLVWVVDGTRRKRDGNQFLEALNNGARFVEELPIVKVRSDECALLREWAGSNAPVFFDFGTEQVLSWLIAGRADGPAYVGSVSHASFIEMHRGGVTQMARDFDEFVKDFSGLVADYESYLRAQALKRSSPQPLQGFQRYLARGDRRRSRL
jgi:competence protein CoiA